MMPLTVWFNKYLSNTWEILSLLQIQRRPGEFRLLCTHPRRHYPGRKYADVFEPETDNLPEADYVAHCLDIARRHEVKLFLPGRQVFGIVKARPLFEALGTRIVAAANPATLALLGNKARFYRDLAGFDVHVPDYAVVSDLAGFDAAWSRMRSRHDWLCYKPAVSVYGLGFHVIIDRSEPAPQARVPGVEPHLLLTLDEARTRFAQQKTCADLLVMPYLPGPEWSVDCLARDGELLRAIVRRKGRGEQLIDDQPDIVAAVRRLTRHFRLENLFNVQFRQAHGKPYLLEINPRMSGGLPLACESGLNLPLWAIRLAMGTAHPEDIPEPRTGSWLPQPEPMRSL